MGISGTAVFSDDSACDIRAEFRELIGDGSSPSEATARLIERYKTILDDPDDDDEVALFWIALAATQNRCGRLQEEVKLKAVEIIDSGEELKRWRDAFNPRDYRKREGVLLKLKDQLLGPQRPPTRIRKVYQDSTDWEVGHAVAYKLLSEHTVVMRVIGIHDEGKSRTPIVELCDWIGVEPPDAETIAGLPIRNTMYYTRNLKELGPESGDVLHDHKFTVYSMAKRDFPTDRVRVVATGLAVEETDVQYASYFGGWKLLDDFLRTEYEIE